jgi:hypothetical protein
MKRLVLRQLIVLLSVVSLPLFGSAVTAGAVTLHSPVPAIAGCYNIADNYGSGYLLTPVGQNYPVQTTTSSSCWWRVHGQRWTNPVTHQIVQVFEIQNYLSGLCLNVPLSRVVYTNSCVAGDHNELFEHSGPLGREWYINVAMTENYGVQAVLYANHISDGSSVSISIDNPPPNANDLWKSWY